MFLHVGNDFSVYEKDIIGIFDLDTVSLSKSSKNWLMQMQKDGRVVDLSGDIPKSCILCMRRDGPVLYLSQVSSRTVGQRTQS